MFGPDCTQAHVYYRVLEPLIAEVLEGYNCTVFAYGQTGTGKTHTIIGDLKKCSEEVGIILILFAHTDCFKGVTTTIFLYHVSPHIKIIIIQIYA